MHLSFTSLLLGPSVAVALISVVSPLPVADCQRRIEHAYEQFEQLQRAQQKGVVEVHFSSGTIYRQPGTKKLTTTTAHFTLISKPDHVYLSDGEVDLYQDNEVQVSVMHRQHTILITAKQAQNAAILSQWTKMRDQLKTQTNITKYALQPGKGTSSAQRFIETQPLPGSAAVGKLTSVSYWLDARTDALQQMTIYYPAGYGLHSASLVMESQQIKTQDRTVDQPALSQVFGRDSKLLPIYRSFKVQDLRRN